MLAICALGFLALAGYLELVEVVRPVTAALSIGALLLLLAALALLVARLTTGRRRRSARGGAGGRTPADGLEDALEARVDPVLNDYLKRHPERAALITLLLGVAAGYSRTSRRVLQDLYELYIETESERRATARR